MQQRDREESNTSTSTDLTDSYNVTASVHTVYCAELNFDFTNNGKKKQIYYNMQKCLNNQVGVSNKQISYSLNGIDPKFKQKINYQMDKLQQPIEQILNLPYLNPEYISFFPIELESQFMYRFNTCSEPLFNPVFNVSQKMKITVFAPDLSSDQKKSQHTNGIPQANNGAQQQLKQIPVEQNTICQKFMAARQNGTVRSLQLIQERSTMNVLLLHDFFQTPLHLIPVINYLSSKECEMNVVAPYMADFTQLVYKKNTDEMLIGVLRALLQYVKTCFNGQRYNIVCQGTSTLYGLKLQHLDLNCVKNIVMNPLIKMRVKQKKLKAFEPESKHLRISETKTEDPENSDYSYYACSTSESNERGDTVSDKYSSTNEHINAIKYQPNQISLYYNKKGKQDSKEPGILTYIDPGSEITSSQVQKKSQLLGDHKFTYSDSLIVDYSTMKLHQDQRSEEQQLSMVQGIEDVNRCLQELYCNKNNMEAILSILGIKNIAKLILPTNLDQFIDINSKFYFQSKKQDQFYLFLFGLYMFSSITALHGYRIYKEVCDNYFFQMIEEMQYSICPQGYRFDGPQNVMILISTNSCMMNREQLARILDIDEQNININARTVLGAGQDLFYAGAGLIENILTSNG